MGQVPLLFRRHCSTGIAFCQKGELLTAILKLHSTPRLPSGQPLAVGSKP
jgi:hypothetical protein